ncbi:MAG: hypothetical protein ABMB14_28225 [Myxococcota bacterium]
MLPWIPVALAGCAAPSGVSGAPDPIDTAENLPGHDACLPVGEAMSDDVCRAVVRHDNRIATVSSESSGVPAPDPDPRLTDPEYQWLTSEVRRCTCSCCHSTEIGGPGSHRWDLDFEPMWIDSASDWALTVFVGDTEEPDQTLPSSDPERLRRVIDRELSRRND